MDNLFPPCPAGFRCPITHFRMVNPVIAKDGHSYEHDAIQKWFDAGNRRSPLQNNVIDTELIPNHAMMTRIKEWVVANTGLNGLQKQLKTLHGPLVTATTSKEALDAIVMISKLVTRSTLSNFCILGSKGVQKMRLLIDTTENLSDDVTHALDTLEQQCISDVFELRQKHAQVLQQRTKLQKAKKTVLGVQQGGGGALVGKLKKDADTAEKIKVRAENAVEKARQLMARLVQAVEEATAACEKMKEPLERFDEQISLFEKLESEMNEEEEKIEQQLLFVMEELVAVDQEEGKSSKSSSSSSCSTTSSSSSKSGSSKRRSSSFSSSSASARRSKHQKNKLTEEEEEERPGQWLYMEGKAYYYAYNFKNKDKERGQVMIEASASAGFPLGVAFCHYMGWNGLEEDFRKVFEICFIFEKEANGSPSAQYGLAHCYRNGLGTDADDDKAFELYTKSAEQGNSRAMNGLGLCYENGYGCEENYTKSFQCSEKSAKLGDSAAMANVGFCYEEGSGVSKDLIKAQEWYRRAAAIGDEDAQEALARLNCSCSQGYTNRPTRSTN